MENDLKLFMVLLGCKPKGRNTEQHDIFFGIGRSLSDLKPSMVDFWKEAEGKLHIDGWREVKQVDEFAITVVDKVEVPDGDQKLFFINLGGYKPNEFEEFHYKLLTVSNDKGAAIQRSKETIFYKHTGFPGAVSHVDDKYGIDVDDIYEIEDILPIEMKERYSIRLNYSPGTESDELHLGYLKFDKI